MNDRLSESTMYVIAELNFSFPTYQASASSEGPSPQTIYKLCKSFCLQELFTVSSSLNLLNQFTNYMILNSTIFLKISNQVHSNLLECFKN